MMNAFKSIFYKEFCLLKNRLKSYCTSIISFYLLIILIFKFNEYLSPSLAVLYSAIYMGFISYLYLLRFWEEKVTGTMEYTFTLGLSIKRIVIFKVLSYALLGLISVILFFTLSSVILFNFNIFNLIISIFIYFLFAIPYGLTNGCGMWCLKKGVATLIQVISILLIATFVGGVTLTISNADASIFYLPAILIVSAIFWLIGIVLFIKATKEKAILSTIE